MNNQSALFACIIMGVQFIVMAIIFVLLKEKGAMLISGFNTLSKEKRELYDKARMSVDMRNANLLWGVILIIGGTFSYLVNFYFAVGAIVIWLMLFFKEVKLDPDKAFYKYRV